MDLLGQVAVAADPGTPLRSTALKAVEALGHGVVTYSSVEDLPVGDSPAAPGGLAARGALPA
jgi:hypothetical protein